MKKILLIILFNLAFKAHADTDLKEYYLQKIIDPNKAITIYNDVHRFSKEFNIDERLITAIIQTESNFSSNAASKKGAIGLMQLMPGTAELLNINAADPTENVYGGIKYFSLLLKKNNNDIPLTLAAYNAGMGNVTKYDSIPPFAETQNYINQVLNIYQELSNTAADSFYSNEFANTNFEWENNTNEIENTK
ncbi:lytic transglycosylase domain-containing protein [Fusobacterium sp.]|uniref:lytic transglycosylase domain-containing protein n=1 Tax=Fusobacterium sp. TaxID=68766 RepID=UPI001E0DCE65|nr:lytic transglycosylase domain-containing protein [Fusobacterium sp.]MBS5790606.1 lytic transglycosylase domain-containing protein [Fusobacterium sp.]